MEDAIGAYSRAVKLGDNRNVMAVSEEDGGYPGYSENHLGMHIQLFCWHIFYLYTVLLKLFDVGNIGRGYGTGHY